MSRWSNLILYADFDADLSSGSCGNLRGSHARTSYTNAKKSYSFAYAFLDRRFLERKAECIEKTKEVAPAYAQRDAFGKLAFTFGCAYGMVVDASTVVAS